MSQWTKSGQAHRAGRLAAITKRPGGILLFYSLLTLILTHPLSLNLNRAVPSDIGDPLLNTWILAWDTHALLTAPLNLFDANIFHPLPNTLAYSEHLFSTALLALPLQLISAEPVVAYNLSLLATFPLAAFGTYLLLLRWTGCRNAAFVGGLIFGFTPYRLAAIAHLQLLTFQWLPFALLFLDKIITGQRQTLRHHLALAIFALLQILASWYLAIYTGLILGIYLLVALLARGSTRSRLVSLSQTLLAAGLLVLPFVLPYLALIDDLQQARPLSLALSLAAAPTDFMAAAPFNTLFGPLTGSFRTRPGFTEENMLFVGLVGPLLAFLAIITWPIKNRGHNGIRKTQYAPRLISSLTILTLALILTFPTPYATLAQLIPATTIIRVPARWIIPALFALAQLAAVGYAIIHRYLSKPRLAPATPSPPRSLRQAILLVTCTTLLLSESLSVPLPLAPVQNRATLSPAYPWLAQQPPNFALLELPLHSAPAPEFPEVKRLYASTLGWWPLLNGYSGYTPPRQMALAQQLANFPDETSITALQKLAETIPNSQSTIRNSQLFLLIHPGEAPLERSQWETTHRWQAERNPALLPLGQFAGDPLYRVIPTPNERFSAPPVATFGPNQSIQLLATYLQSPTANLILYWRPATPLATNYTVFIHLRAADGFVRSQADGPPVGGHYPTARWQAGEIIQDIHPLPGADFSQVDHLAVGLYDPQTGQRLPAFDSGGRRLADDAVIIPLP